MNRRSFVRKGIASSIALGAYLASGRYNDLLSGPPIPYDLVAVKGGEPDVMFDKAIAEFGGMQTFVRKGDNVVVKPNIGWDVPPERGGNTNPLLVSRIIRHCLEAGAREVYVVDHTCDEWQRCYANSGIERAVKDAGGKVIPGHSESYYQNISIPRGRVLQNTKEHEVILGANVFINVPVLKNHSGARLTIAMKNLMGNVWDRGFWHRNDLHQCIADFATYRKPTLNVVDAYTVLRTNGPRGVSLEDVVTMKSLLISTDIVAVDAAAAKLFGHTPEEIRHIQIAAEMGVGRKDLDKLNIKRIRL